MTYETQKIRRNRSRNRVDSRKQADKRTTIARKRARATKLSHQR